MTRACVSSRNAGSSLIKDPEMMSAFRGLGFRPYTLKRSWVGINPEEARLERKTWGLTQPGKGPDPDVLIIPAGLVIPRFNGAALEHITVRPLPQGPGIPTPAVLMGALMDTESDTSSKGQRRRRWSSPRQRENLSSVSPTISRPFSFTRNSVISAPCALCKIPPSSRRRTRQMP